MPDPQRPQKVFVTGASGFVGRHIVRELLARGCTPVCLSRDPGRMRGVIPEAAPGQIIAIRGDLDDEAALVKGAQQSQAIIHLVGIIAERPLRGQTFERVHVEGTRKVMAAAKATGVARFVHMSALGTRPDAISQYHRTKWRAEEIVRNSGLSWTIFRPSVIHGPDGAFMSLMKTFVTGLVPPVIPYFGSGDNKLQPVSVRDVAHCFVTSLDLPATFRQVYCLGGPQAYSWKELYRTCKELIPGAWRFKPMVGQPVGVAKLVARTVMKTPLVPRKLKFNVDQVQMSQEDSVCDTGPVEAVFGMRMRDFRAELSQYADQIR